MHARQRLGLPVGLAADLEALPEPIRQSLEEAYMQACREVGRLFLQAGQLREAWMYLRVAGEKQMMANALAAVEPAAENIEALVEIALHEGVDTALGYRLVLAHYGTCNAITMFDSVAHGRPPAERQALAALLIEHVHQELLTSLRADIERREGAPPAAGATIAELVADRPGLFADLNYHVDASHLAATVRVARLVEDPRVLASAIDLTEYGRRLDNVYQYPGEAPFKDLYSASGLFFAAQLGRNVDDAIDYFRQQAESGAETTAGSGPAEVYVALLARLGRLDEAMQESSRLLPGGASSSGFAPSLLELARRANDFRQAALTFQQRGDLLGYAAARIESRSAPSRPG